MQPLPRLPGGPPGQEARPGALDDHAELEAGQRQVPVQVVGGPPAGANPFR